MLVFGKHLRSRHGLKIWNPSWANLEQSAFDTAIWSLLELLLFQQLRFSDYVIMQEAPQPRHCEHEKDLRIVELVPSLFMYWEHLYVALYDRSANSCSLQGSRKQASTALSFIAESRLVSRTTILGVVCTVFVFLDCTVFCLTHVLVVSLHYLA